MKQTLPLSVLAASLILLGVGCDRAQLPLEPAQPEPTLEQPAEVQIDAMMLEKLFVPVEKDKVKEAAKRLQRWSRPM